MEFSASRLNDELGSFLSLIFLTHLSPHAKFGMRVLFMKHVPPTIKNVRSVALAVLERRMLTWRNVGGPQDDERTYKWDDRESRIGDFEE